MAFTQVNQGAITSITALAANQMPDIDRIMYLLEPHQTPLTQWLHFNNLGKAEKVINENGKYSWMEDELVPVTTTLSGAGITGGGSSEDNIGLTDGTIFAEGDILLVELTEQMVYVDSVAGGDVDITHIDGSTTITAATSGTIRKIGSRNHELATARTAVSTLEIEKFNYNQIYSETVYTSGRYQSGDKYTDKKSHKEQVQKKIKEMKLQFEDNALFSKATGTVTVSTYYRFTYSQGFLGRVTTNATPYTAALDEDELDDYLKTVFTKGSGTKMHICGGDHIVYLEKIIKDRYQVVPDPITKIYGIDLVEYRTKFGRFQIIWHPRMTGKFSYYGYTLDPEHIKLRYQANDDKGSRMMRVEENVETPGTDGKMTKILMDKSVMIMNEEVHGILYK